MTISSRIAARSPQPGPAGGWGRDCHAGSWRLMWHNRQSTTAITKWGSQKSGVRMTNSLQK